MLLRDLGGERIADTGQVRQVELGRYAIAEIPVLCLGRHFTAFAQREASPVVPDRAR